MQSELNSCVTTTKLSNSVLPHYPVDKHVAYLMLYHGIQDTANQNTRKYRKAVLYSTYPALIVLATVSPTGHGIT